MALLARRARSPKFSSIPSPVLRSACGSSYIEFAIVLPVLLILMMGTVDFGRLVGQLNWASTVNFETALIGAETSSEAGVSVMQQAFGRGVNNHLSSGHAAIEWDELLVGEGLTEYKTADRTVVASSSWIARSVFNYLPLDFGLTYTAPQLLTTQDLSAGELDEFDNAECVFDCTGACGAAAGACSDAVAFLPTPPPVPVIPTPVATPPEGWDPFGDRWEVYLPCNPSLETGGC